MNILWWIFPIALASGFAGMLAGAKYNKKVIFAHRIDTGYPTENAPPTPEPPKITALSIDKDILGMGRKPKIEKHEWMK